ncbi:SRPBCC family protein [Serinicoccus kebangsaanensis]|uniref:SRPBCC family protein n=1 Tax=Serinicoccus kebangsaanensis TaxID=2602069 RepID=UPI00124CA802|nr:SRPBCC family protein [Serinicoccus kebangsaanensis]
MDVTVATIFDAPRPLVAAVAGDPDQAMRWYSNIRSVRWEADPCVEEGARVDFVARFLGRELAYTYEIVDLVPDERLVMRTDDGPFPMETTYTWWDEDEAEGRARTGMSVRNAGRPKAMTTLASGAVTLGMKRAMRRDLERLRLVLREEQDAAGGRS